jgi:hypothetical protein
LVYPYFFDGLGLADFFGFADFFVSIITSFVFLVSFFGLLCHEATFLVFTFFSTGSFDLVTKPLEGALVSTSLSPTLDRSTFSNFSTFLLA